MKKWNLLLALLAMLGFVLVGCNSGGGSDEETLEEQAAQEEAEGTGALPATEQPQVPVTAVKYCGSCGHQVSADAHTCDTEHAKCDSCGLHKGAELCCKISGDFQGQLLCGKCGEVAGSDNCCKEGVAVCEKCGLHKGSPLCCKLTGAEQPVGESGEKPAESEQPAATESSS